METDLMVEMGQIRLLGFYPFYYSESLIYRKMREVFAEPESVDDEHVQSLKFLKLLFRNGFSISYVGEFSNSVA